MPSVLTIDDYQPTRDTHSTLLQLAGFRSATAATGLEGIALALQELFDAILVDLQLPDVSGIDVVRELKCRNIQARLVIVTAFAGFDSAFESAEAGADGYVDGPLFGDEVVDVAQQAIHGPHPVRHPARRAVRLDEREPRRSSMDPRVRKAIDLIEAELHESPSMAELAARLELSESAFGHLFEANVGVPPARYRVERRLHAATIRLTTSFERVGQVAQSVGFPTLKRSGRSSASALACHLPSIGRDFGEGQAAFSHWILTRRYEETQIAGLSNLP